MDDFARVKDAVDLVDVVQQYVPLKRAGARMVGLCPFHAEKSPSFGIPIGQKYFKCFGCGKGGDVITFVAEVERIERIDALRRLAEQHGIELSHGDFVQRDEKERLLRALDAAQQLYRKAYANEVVGAAARALVEARKLRVDVADAFGLGYAPMRPGAPFHSGVIANRLVAAGHRREDVVGAGLAYDKEGELVDSMVDRVTFPIRDERGRVIAFGGRRMSDGPDAPPAKYKNSSETPVFSKSRVLYGLDRARPQILKAGRVVLVEGYMDVVLAHQAGLDLAIAALGTSVTAEHCKHLFRIAPNAVLFLDGDDAGQRAAERAVPLLLAEKLAVKVLVLKVDKDPGDFFARGATREEFEALVDKDGVSGLHYLLQRAGRAGARTLDDRIRVARQVGEALGEVSDPLARASHVEELARELDLPTTELDRALGLRPGRRNSSPTAPGAASGPVGDGKVAPVAPTAESAPPAQVIAEEELLIALIHDPLLRGCVAPLLEPGAFVDLARAKLLQALVNAPAADAAELIEANFSGEPDAQQKLLDLVHRPVSADPGKLLDGAVRWFDRQRQKRQSEEIRAGFRERLAAGDPAAASEFLEHYERLRRTGGQRG